MSLANAIVISRRIEIQELAQEIISSSATLNAFVARKESLEEYFIREIEGKRQAEREAKQKQAEAGKQEAQP